MTSEDDASLFYAQVDVIAKAALLDDRLGNSHATGVSDSNDFNLHKFIT